VLQVAAASPAAAREALEELCRRYWYPAYAFVRRRGATHHEAEDLTQGFFAALLSSDGLTRADPERGRFRTFLLTALSHFLTDEWRRAHAARRGGGETPVPLAAEDADERYSREPADPGLTPGEAFDHHWAMSTIEHAIADLRAEYSRTQRGLLVDALGPFVWGGSLPPPQAEAAAALGMTEHAFTVAVHRLRHRLRDHLRALVAATVADASDVESELRFLLAVVRRRPVAV
jgi:RNA polymerase sigma-70 factor (ECF subfamily)